MIPTGGNGNRQIDLGWSIRAGFVLKLLAPWFGGVSRAWIDSGTASTTIFLPSLIPALPPAENVGHLFNSCPQQKVPSAKEALTVGDDKTGAMNLKVREQRKSESLSVGEQAALEALLEKTQSSAKIKLNQSEWHRMRVRIEGDLMEAYLDGERVASLTSPGIDHPTKTKFGMTVNGSTIDFDNLKVFAGADEKQ